MKLKFGYEGFLLEAIEIAHKMVESASEKQASDIVLLDTRQVCSFADYFLICTGESSRQVKAIVGAVEQTLKEAGVRHLHQEGNPESGWLLIDCGEVIVHIFSPLERDYYQLEKLWSNAGTIVRMQ